MLSTDELMTHPPTMAEVVGGVLEDDVTTDRAAAVIAAEMAAEGHGAPEHPHAAPMGIPAQFASIEVDTEE